MVFDVGNPRRGSRRIRSGDGFSLLELMMAVVVMGIVATIAIPTYSRYLTRMKTSTAIADITRIHMAIERYSSDKGKPPPNLATINLDGMIDPWGNGYVYLSFEGLHGVGQMRKDKNLVPINSAYDLYSMGPDGRSVGPLTARASRDDIVMANDGKFIGVAEDY
jgi:general secretion pathway protein G